METLNKNWFAFTLIAVIFACLGYFCGKHHQPHACCHKQKHAQCQITKDVHHRISIDSDGIKANKEMEIEEETGENGEKTITVKVKKQEEE